MERGTELLEEAFYQFTGKKFRPEMDLLGLQNLDKHECSCHCFLSIQLLLEQICIHFLQ